MTGRATFGDFLHQARRSLDPGDRPGGVIPSENLENVISALARLLAVMRRYTQDLTATLPETPPRAQPVLSPWAEASSQARDALATATRFLTLGDAWLRPAVTSPPGTQARRLDTATASLRMGRDLLQTHFATDPDGGRRPRSEWAHVITSETVARALLMELAGIARKVAGRCSPLALSASATVAGNRNARRRLNLACQWLWVVEASVRAAQQRAPIGSAGTELLSAIPVNTLPSRRVLHGGETIAELCDGAVSSAQRVRHLAWVAADRVTAAQNVTVASMRQVTEHGTVISHNCAGLLDTLAVRLAQVGQQEAGERAAAAADAARRARGSWLHAAREAARIRTATPSVVSSAAFEVAELTSWTGRLAYADPQWLPADGPDRPLRAPATLSAEDLTPLIAVVHHVCATLTGLAHAEHDQVRAAAQAGRLYVLTRSLPDEYDIPYRFARAPQERVEVVLKRYGETAQASCQAADAVGEVAGLTRAPSRILALARSAAAGRADPTADADDAALRDSADTDRGTSAAGVPGPVETTLLDLGVTDPSLLARSAQIDHDAERLIIDAAIATDAHQRPVRGLSRSTGTAALVNHALQSGDLRAIALIRPPMRAQREPPEREP